MDDQSEDASADLTPVTIHCVACDQDWQEFKAVADHLFTRETTAGRSPRYVADRTNCVFCNPTPGDTWRTGPYL